MNRKLSAALVLILVLVLLAACAPAAEPNAQPTQRPQLTQRPPKVTAQPPRPTRPPLPTKTAAQVQQPTPTNKPVQSQPTATQAQTSNLTLGRKFEGIFTRTLLCKGGMVWGLGGFGLILLNPETMSATEIPIDNLVGGPWAAGDYIWTYEYLSTDQYNGGYLVGYDADEGVAVKYLDMMQNLEWETFLLGMGEVGGEYWVSLDAPQALLIDKINGKSVGAAELPGVARIILYDGKRIWFAGDELFIMTSANQQFSTVLEEYVTGLDTDFWNVWVMTLEGTLYKFDLTTETWEEIFLSPDAWAGCFDGESYWYADAYQETVQEVILP